MTRKHPRLSVVWLVGTFTALALAVSACGGGSSSSSSPETSAGGGEATEAASEASGLEDAAAGGKLGLLLDGNRNDKSFSQAAYEGARKAADELGLEFAVIDGLGEDVQKGQSALLNLAAESDYVINGDHALVGSTPKVAAKYPDKQFSVYEQLVESSDNLHWAILDWYPLGYLAGVAAANASKSGVVGFVGGDQIPPTISGEAGFKDGAKAVDPTIKTLSTITGSFEESAKGQQAAAAQIAQGADVIYSFLDAAHLGAVEAASEAGGVSLIGVIESKCDVSQGHEIGDTTARPDEMVRELAHGMASGEIEDTEYGVQNEEIAGFEFCPGGASPAIEKAVETARQEFTEGALTTPTEFKASAAE